MQYASIHMRIKSEHLGKIAALAQLDSASSGRQVSQADILRQAVQRYLRERAEDVAEAEAQAQEEQDAPVKRMAAN